VMAISTLYSPTYSTVFTVHHTPPE
jgi:hypothetical protein